MNVLTLLVGLLLIAVTLFYGRGWVRLHRRGVPFANLPRLVVFLFAMTLTAIVFLSPLNWLNQEYLFVRVAQHVFLCLFAVPAFFISFTFDIAVWELPKSSRRAISRWVHSRGLLRRAVHGANDCRAVGRNPVGRAAGPGGRQRSHSIGGGVSKCPIPVLRFAIADNHRAIGRHSIRATVGPRSW